MSAQANLQEALQQSAMLVEYYQQQIESQVNQVEMLQSTLRTMRSTRSSIAALATIEDEEVLVPLGGDTMVRVRPGESGTTLVGIGSGVLVEKSYEDAEKTLTERLAEMEEVHQRMIGNLDQLKLATQRESARVEQLYAQAQAMGLGPGPGGPLNG